MAEQTKLEEQFNAISHGIGALLGIAGLVLLIVFSANKTDWSLFSVVVYGISIIVLFTASTLYHSVSGEKRKHYFRIIDHISIYILIAGTYTPVLLITLVAFSSASLVFLVSSAALANAISVVSLSLFSGCSLTTLTTPSVVYISCERY